MKTTKMKFSEDKFVNGECVYQKGKTYDIPNVSVERWLKRGGVIIGEEKQILEPETPKTEAPKATVIGEEKVEEPAKPEVKKKPATAKK